MLSGVPLPMHNVRQGALIGAVILTCSSSSAASSSAGPAANPLLGAVAVAVGLLFWLNLMSKVVLLSAAWAANDVDLDHLGDDTGGASPPWRVPCVPRSSPRSGPPPTPASCRMPPRPSRGSPSPPSATSHAHAPPTASAWPRERSSAAGALAVTAHDACATLTRSRCGADRRRAAPRRATGQPPIEDTRSRRARQRRPGSKAAAPVARSFREAGARAAAPLRPRWTRRRRLATAGSGAASGSGLAGLDEQPDRRHLSALAKPQSSRAAVGFHEPVTLPIWVTTRVRPPRVAAPMKVCCARSVRPGLMPTAPG